MTRIANFIGIIGDYFRIGRAAGFRLKNNSAVAEIKNFGDTDFATLRAAFIQSSNAINDVPTILDAMNKLIEFDFAGADAPSPGANSAKFGFCHTSGGTTPSYTAGDVVYDTGSAILVFPVRSAKQITTTAAITGTVSLNANAVYARETDGDWVLKGDGNTGGTGNRKVIELDLAYNSGATISSTTSIPSGYKIYKVTCRVDSAFNTAATVAVSVNGSTPLTIMSTTQNNLQESAEWVNEDTVDVASVNAGVVQLAYTASSASAGAATIIVEYGDTNS